MKLDDDDDLDHDDDDLDDLDDDDLDDDDNVRAEKQKRVDVCVGFLNDNKNKAEEMRQVSNHDDDDDDDGDDDDRGGDKCFFCPYLKQR